MINTTTGVAQDNMPAPAPTPTPGVVPALTHPHIRLLEDITNAKTAFHALMLTASNVSDEVKEHPEVQTAVLSLFHQVSQADGILPVPPADLGAPVSPLDNETEEQTGITETETSPVPAGKKD